MRPAQILGKALFTLSLLVGAGAAALPATSHADELDAVVCATYLPCRADGTVDPVVDKPGKCGDMYRSQCAAKYANDQIVSCQKNLAQLQRENDRLKRKIRTIKRARK